MKKFSLILLLVTFSYYSFAQSVTTDAATSVAYYSATLNGTFTNIGGSYWFMLDAKFEYSINSDLSASTIVDGTPDWSQTDGETSYANIASLSSNTTYYYRFYADAYDDNGNPKGTIYGSIVSFTTPNTIPTISFLSLYNISATGATVRALVASEGAGLVNSRGVCYDLSSGADITNTVSVYSTSSGTGLFIKSISGLSPGTEYYFNVYATNASGTGYGTEKSFITNTIDPTSNAATDILETSFTANWTAVTGAQGYYLDVSTLSDFSSFVTGFENLDVGNVTTYSVAINLTSGTDYYYRVRAYHDGGADGPDFTSGNSGTQSLKTRSLPTMSCGNATTINQTSATVQAELLDNGGSTITQRGICWGTSSGVTTSNNTIIDGGTNVGTYSGNLAGLSAGTKYFYNSYAINSTGTGYGTELNFITNTEDPISSAATNITGSSFSANWSSVTGAQGYYLDVSENSSFSSFVSGFQNKDVGNVITFSVTSASPTTTYYYRVRAYHDGGSGGSDFTSGNSGTQTLTTISANPSIQASELKWETIGSDFSFNWVYGNGEGTVMVMKDGGAVTDPSDGVTYTANSVFGSGDQIGSTGTYVVYNALHSAKANSSTTVSNVQSGHTYYVKLLEYNGSGASRNYNPEETSGFGNGNIGSTSLPVSLLSFTANEINGNAELNWETASEINNDFFIIERSTDAENFSPIAKIQGAGNSNTILKYQYIDYDVPTNTQVYYRLHQYDFDGKDEILQIVTLSIKELSATINNVYAEDNSLQIDYSNPEGNMTVIKLIDINGRMLQMAFSSTSGQQNVNFDMSGMSHGIYFISMEQENTRVTRKVVF